MTECPKLWKQEGTSFYPIAYATKKTYKLISKRGRQPTPSELRDWVNSKWRKDGVDYWTHDALLQSGLYEESTDVPPEEADGIVLPVGVYMTRFSTNKGWYLSSLPVREERLIELGDVQRKVERDISQFFGAKDLYQQHGATYKRGYLFYGPPGNGKSCLLRQLIRGRCEDCIVIYLTDDPPSESLRNVLRQDPRMKVFIIEELTEAIDRDLSKFLSFLDGEHTIDNSITIATTNYSGALPSNLIHRPGRFDILLKFGDPEEEIRERLLRHVGVENPEEYISLTEGMSVSAVLEVVRRAHLHEVSLRTAITEFKAQQEAASKDFGESSREEIGFGSFRDKSDAPW